MRVSASIGVAAADASIGSVTEWVKAEDLERMETYIDYGPQQEQEAAPAEQAYDIF